MSQRKGKSMNWFDRLNAIVEHYGGKYTGQLTVANRLEITDRTVRNWLKSGTRWEPDYMERAAIEKLESETWPQVVAR